MLRSKYTDSNLGQGSPWVVEYERGARGDGQVVVSVHIVKLHPDDREV